MCTLKFHFSLTFFKDLNFPGFKVKFPDFSLTCHNHANGGSPPPPGVIHANKTTLLQNDRQQS